MEKKKAWEQVSTLSNNNSGECSIDAEFETACCLFQLAAVPEKIIVFFVITALDLQYVDTDQKTLGGQMQSDLFVSAADSLHADLAIRQVHFNIQYAVLTDKVFLVKPDGRHQECDPGAAHIDGFTQNAGPLRTFAVVFSIDSRFDPNLHRGDMLLSRGHDLSR